MGHLNKTMDRLNKPFGPITTLVIIYLGLVMVSVAIYALIQMYVEEKELAASLLSWTATIALLFTFDRWRNQKASEIIANEAKIIIEKIHFQREVHINLLFPNDCEESNKFNLKKFDDEYNYIERKVSFLNKLIESEYSEQEFVVFNQKQKEYLQSYNSFLGALKTDQLLMTFNINDSDIYGSYDTKRSADNYGDAYFNMCEILIKICLHQNIK